MSMVLILCITLRVGSRVFTRTTRKNLTDLHFGCSTSYFVGFFIGKIMKICTKCEIKKEFEEFYKDKKKKDGLYSACKECMNKKQTRYNKENKEKYDNYMKEYYIKNNERIKEQQKEYYKESKDKKIEYSKEYQKQNKEKIKQQQKKYKKENIEEIRKYRREYVKERRKNDPQFRIADNLRRGFYKGIISQGIVKSASSQELLGCTWEEGRIYIENQFMNEMSWENYGEWEIDHIRPMASFDLTDPEQQRQCFHYSNLRPLWREENNNKSSWWNGVKY